MGKTSKLSLTSSSKKMDVIAQRSTKKSKIVSNNEKKTEASKRSSISRDVFSVKKTKPKHSENVITASFDEPRFFFGSDDREFFSGKTMSSLMNEAYEQENIYVFAEVCAHGESSAPKHVFYADADKVLKKIIRLSGKEDQEFRNELFDFPVADVKFMYGAPWGGEKKCILSVADMIGSSHEAWTKQSYLSAIVHSSSYTDKTNLDGFVYRALTFALFSMGNFVQKNIRAAEIVVQKINDEEKEMAFTRALSKAALFSTPDVVQFLIDNGADPNPIGFDWDNYPLGNAAMVNNIPTLKELLKHGADPDYREPNFNPSPLEAGFNPSPLELAESRGYKEAVDLMRETSKAKGRRS